MKTIAITKPRGTTMHVLALLRATALSCVLFASSPLSADVWVAGDARIAKLATSGQTLVTVDSVFGRGFAYGVGIQDIIGVEQRNGHVWVSDVNNNRVFELDPDGKPLREITLLSPFGIGIDPNSGTVWTSILLNQVTFPRAVIKLDPNTGEELVRVTGFSRFVSAISVAPSGRVWIADRFNNEVVVLFGTDEELNGYDASTPSGPHHLRLSGFDEPLDIAIDPGNRSRGGESTWVADRNHGQAVKIASDGTELVRVRPTGFFEVRFVSVNSRDGSVWVGDPSSGRVAKLSFLGEEAKNLSINPTALAVDVKDDAVWIGTGIEEARVLKLDSDGSELLSMSGLGTGTIDGIAATLSATVVIGGCNSGVTNTVLTSGRTISDLIAECAKGARNHGQFVSCVAHVTNELKETGTISGQQKGAIQSCAAQAHIP
jgi:streptogramin lyase